MGAQWKSPPIGHPWLISNPSTHRHYGIVIPAGVILTSTTGQSRLIDDPTILLTKCHGNAIQRGVSWYWHRCFSFIKWKPEFSEWLEMAPLWVFILITSFTEGARGWGNYQRGSADNRKQSARLRPTNYPAQTQQLLLLFKANKEKRIQNFLSTSFLSELQWPTAIPLW